MVTSEALMQLMGEPRNGTARWHQHPRGGTVSFSDGVGEVLKATHCGWLLVTVAVDFVPALRRKLPQGQGYANCIVLCANTPAGDRSAIVTLGLLGEEAVLMKKEVAEAEDFPVGEWSFLLLGENLDTEDRAAFLMLPSEY